MKRYLLLALVAIALVAPASAQSGYSHTGPQASYVKIHNETDAMVWITAYRSTVGGDRNEGAWPVKAHSYDEHGLKTVIDNVRAEINAAPCSGGNKLDSQLGTTLKGNIGGTTVRELVGYVRFEGGHCTFKT